MLKCVSDSPTSVFHRGVDRPIWLHKDESSHFSKHSSNPQPQTMARQKSDLTVAKGAAEYYLSKARYSPSSNASAAPHHREHSGQSCISAQNKAAFLSTQPRFGYLGNPETSAFKKYPSASVLPSTTKPGPARAGGASWCNGCVYHSSISASTTKNAYPGRTDWRAK